MEQKRSKKLQFSRGFVGRFLGRHLQFIVPWLTLVLVFELFAGRSLHPSMSYTVRAAYAIAASCCLRPQVPVWLKENGNMSGDRAILRAVSTSLLLVGALCLLYAFEDSDTVFK